MTPAAISGLAATILATLVLVPQVTKLARGGGIAGVSVTWVGLGAATNVAWTIYLVRERLALAAWSTAIAAVFYFGVWVQLRLQRAPTRRAGLTTGAWALLLVAIYLSFGHEIFGLVMGFTYLVQVTPSLVAAFAEAQPTGVSPGTWALTFVEGALWLHYGLWHSDTPIVVFSLAAMVSGALMVGRYLATRPTTVFAT